MPDAVNDQSNKFERLYTKIAKAQKTREISGDGIALQTLTYMVLTEHIEELSKDIKSELDKVKKGQDKVVALNTLLQTLNSLTPVNNSPTDRKFDMVQAPGIGEMLAQAEKMGVKLPPGLENSQWDNETRERLTENINLTIKNLNMASEMQMQKVNRLMSEQDHARKLLASVMKNLHETLKRMISGIKN